LSESNIEKNNERNVGHKLFVLSGFALTVAPATGKFPLTLKSIPYQKYNKESKTNGISYGKKIYLKMNPPDKIRQK
jgi:hypothetical protein